MTLDQNGILITVLLVSAITVLVLLGIWLLGKFLSDERKIGRWYVDDAFYQFLSELERTNRFEFERLLNSFTNYLKEFLERRNDFWITYGQIVICIFIVGILAILLLTKTISAEAGLPILSAISGFAIAKGTSGRNRGNDNSSNIGSKG